MFERESDLCEAFIQKVPKDWTVYPETCGYDMVLVHETGVQIAVEAKLKLNPKVITQIAETTRIATARGPDFRAIVVPRRGGQQAELDLICRLLGITVISVARADRSFDFRPRLPRAESIRRAFEASRWWADNTWHDQAPPERLLLPEYVPDVPAGVSSPMVLGSWKISAFKLCYLALHRGHVTRRDFEALKVSPARWLDGHWMQKGAVRGQWVPGPHFPLDAWRKSHGSVADQIEADLLKWCAAAGIDPTPAENGRRGNA